MSSKQDKAKKKAIRILKKEAEQKAKEKKEREILDSKKKAISKLKKEMDKKAKAISKAEKIPKKSNSKRGKGEREFNFPDINFSLDSEANIAWILGLMVTGAIIGYSIGYQISYEQQIRDYDVYWGETLLFPGETYVAEEGLEGIIESKARTGGITGAILLGGLGLFVGSKINKEPRSK